MPDPIFDLGFAVAKSKAADITNNVVEYTKAFQTAKSIAERAAKSVVMYPVVVSESLQEIDLMAKITKHLEVEYALFTLISANLLDPNAQLAMNMIVSAEALSNFEIPEVLSKTYRSFEGDDDFEEEIVNLSQQSEEKPRILNNPNDKGSGDAPKETSDLEKMRLGITKKNDLTKEDNLFKSIRTEYALRDKLGTGGGGGGNKGGGKGKTGGDDDDDHSKESYLEFLRKLRAATGDDPQGKKNREFLDGKIAEEFGRGTIKIDPAAIQAAAAANKMKPTIVQFDVPFGDRTVHGSLLIKANLHVVSNVEVDLMIDRAWSDGNFFHRIVQLTTGEISLVSDFILQMDRAEKDEALYNSLGRHPWYRKLQEGKIKAGVTKIVQTAWKDLRMNGTILPTCTLVCTKSEVVAGLREPWAKIVRDSNSIKTLISKYMLLGVVVFDPDTELVYFFYAGFEEPFVYNSRDLKSGGDQVSNLSEAIKSMARKM